VQNEVNQDYIYSEQNEVDGMKKGAEGAHFMQYTQHAIGYSLVRVLQTVETDELTHISVITSV